MNRHTFKRSLFGLLAVALLAVALPTVALAQTDGEPPARDQPVLTEQERTDRLAELKARATEQIEKRLGALERLAGKIEGAKYLEDGHSASLLSDIGATTAVLRTGLSDVAAAETIEELRELVPPIFESTLVFALLGPKTHEVIASDATVGIAARFTENEAKLQDALDRLAETGVDVTEAQQSLDEAARLVANAATTGGTVADSVVNLQPADWPEPAQGALAEGKATLEKARGSLRETHALAKGVIEFIRASIPQQDA